MTTTTDRDEKSRMIITAVVSLILDLGLSVVAFWVAGDTIAHAHWWMTLLAIIVVLGPGRGVTSFKGLSLWLFLLGLLAALDFHTGTHLAPAWVFGLAMLQILGTLYSVSAYLAIGIRYLRNRPKTPRRQIIGLAGYAGAGKDTAAAALVADGWVRVAFADKLKQVAYDLNPLVMFRDQAQRLQDVVDTHGWEVAKRSLDVRALLQRLGTDAVRRHIGADVWIEAAFKDLPPDVNVVITDVRFPNEVAHIRRAGGAVVLVSKPGVGPVNGHDSESALADLAPDADVVNGSTVADLHAAMVQAAVKLAGARRVSP